MTVIVLLPFRQRICSSPKCCKAVIVGVTGPLIVNVTGIASQPLQKERAKAKSKSGSATLQPFCSGMCGGGQIVNTLGGPSALALWGRSSGHWCSDAR
jgi:hypothetical protein